LTAPKIQKKSNPVILITHTPKTLLVEGPQITFSKFDKNWFISLKIHPITVLNQFLHF